MPDPNLASNSNENSDLDQPSDMEEKRDCLVDGSRDGDHIAISAAEDTEKQANGFGTMTARPPNPQVLPGVMLVEDGHDEGTESEGGAGGDGQDAEHGHAGGLSGVVGQAVSRTTTQSSWNPGPPPDGGLRAWTAVAAAHLIIVNTWGYINSFGVFQTYYATALDLPPSTISWIGSIQVFLLFFIGTFTGRLTDAGYFRPTILLGSTFQVVGIFATSACTQYWQIFLAQGICMGIGNGCLFCPALSTVATYFSKKRSLAIGMTACGSATGGLIFPAMARQLLPTVGFGWTIRAIGFVQLVALILANLGLKRRIPPRRTGALVEWAAFEELEYTFYAAGSFTVSRCCKLSGYISEGPGPPMYSRSSIDTDIPTHSAF